MAFCGISLSRSLLGVKQTWPIALHMSAFDPKRTWRLHCEYLLLTQSGSRWGFPGAGLSRYDALS
jgi:hypothetical protein